MREGERERREREGERERERERAPHAKRPHTHTHTQAARNNSNNKSSTKKNHIIQQPPTPESDAQDMVSQHISSSNLCQKRPISVKRGLLQNAYTRHGEPAYQLF